MSIPSNDPRNPYQQAGFPPGDVQQRGGSRAGCIIVGVAGGGLLFILLCRGGGAGTIWFRLAILSKQIETHLRDNPVLVHHLGTIESFDIDMVATFAKIEDDTFVFNVTGQNGSGVVTAKSVTLDDGSQEIVWAQLRLSDGETVDLLPTPP